MKNMFVNPWKVGEEYNSGEVLANNVSENIFSLKKIYSDNYDEFIFGKTKSEIEIPNLYRLCIFYSIDYQDTLALNKKAYPEILKKDFNERALKVGDIIFLPKGTLNSDKYISGDPSSNNTIYVAWTMDDGPRQTFTEQMINALGNIKNTTWFIMYDTFNKYNAEKAKELYLKIQNDGGEIGIHSAHKSKNHCTFFPLSQTEIDSGFQSHTTIQEAVTAISEFNNYLKSLGIFAKFVRPPYGLNSELQYYFKKQGFSTTTKPTHKELANSLISKKDIISNIEDSNLQLKAKKVKDDFEYLISHLKTMGLQIGVTTEVKNLDWDCESNGTTLTDNVTLKVSAKSRTIKEGGNGKFEKMVDEIYSMKKDKYLVVLGHDTSTNNSNEVKIDIEQMEFYSKYCGQFSKKENKLNKEYDKNSIEELKKTKVNGIRIKYVTMSEIIKLKL